GLLVEQQVIVAKPRPGYVPVKVLRFHVQREHVREQQVECAGQVACRVGAQGGGRGECGSAPLLRSFSVHQILQWGSSTEVGRRAEMTIKTNSSARTMHMIQLVPAAAARRGKIDGNPISVWHASSRAWCAERAGGEAAASRYTATPCSGSRPCTSSSWSRGSRVSSTCRA